MFHAGVGFRPRQLELYDGQGERGMTLGDAGEDQIA